MTDVRSCPNPIDEKKWVKVDSLCERKRKILAVVVTYFPDACLKLRILKIRDQFDEVIVIDNTPSMETPLELQLLTGISNLSILRMKRNTGIAYALNEGLKYARNHGYLWVGTFDQDSTIPENYLKDIFASLSQIHRNDKVAILSPVYLLPTGVKKSFSSEDKKVKPIREVPLTMTSGNLLNVSIAESIGGFDEDLFIDYVDFDICLRIRHHGYKIIENINVVLIHELGVNFCQKKFLWIKVGIPNYPAIRVYYITRNRLILYSRYWRFFPGFVLNDVLRLSVAIGKIIFFESDKKEKLKAFIIGFMDGILGHMKVKISV